MTTQKHRSRQAFRQIHKKVPGGAVHVQFVRRKPRKTQCNSCGKPLSGVPSMLAVEARTTAKTKKRPERPYGGILCSRCMRLKIIEKAHEAMRKLQ